MDTTFSRKLAMFPTDPDVRRGMLLRRKVSMGFMPRAPRAPKAEIEARIEAALRTRAPYGDGDGIA